MTAIPEKFHELVVEGPPLLVRGFVAGVLISEGLGPNEVIFAEDQPIQIESLMEQIGEWMRLHRANTHLLVSSAVYHDLKRRLQVAESLVGLHVKVDRLIESASFEFSYNAYTTRHFAELREFFDKLPPGARLSTDYQPTESRDPTAKGDELYAPTHDYEASAQGEVSGSLPVILDLHKKAGDLKMLQASKITLAHADD